MSNRAFGLTKLSIIQVNTRFLGEKNNIVIVEEQGNQDTKKQILEKYVVIQKLKQE